MNIEEDLTSLKEIVAIRKERCHGFIESDSCLISTKRLETLLTAYEEKGEECDFLDKELYNANQEIQKLQINIQKEKEKNKELEKKLDEISEIHFPIIY